jgi:lactoylglutathione lyase
MKILHIMFRVVNLDRTLSFFVDLLNFQVVRRMENSNQKYSLIYLTNSLNPGLEIELTFNWDVTSYTLGNSFGHIALAADHLYLICERCIDMGFVLARPPRDGCMAFIKSPDGISFELLQTGPSLPPQEPWLSMPNVGTW